MLPDKNFIFYLLTIILVLLFIMICLNNLKKDKKEGFGTFYNNQDKFSKSQEHNYWNNFNKTLSVNSELPIFSNLSSIFQTTDTLNNSKNKKEDYSVYFEKDILPGIGTRNLQCSGALEPKLLPAHKNNYSAGCGWWYVDDPSVSSVGSYGTTSGPLDSEGLKKSAPGGTWMWDLVAAQKKEDIKRCRRVKSCEVADMIPGKCGFCTSFLAGVPIDERGNSKYPDDPTLSCEGSIVTNPTKCPRPAPPRADPNNPVPSTNTQPLAGTCDPNPATGQLTNDCLKLLALGAGCTEDSVIIDILSGDNSGYFAPSGANHNKFLIATQTIKSDTSLASPDQFFGIGVCSRSEALGYYNSIVKTAASGPTPKSRGSAGFLAYGKDFDECATENHETGPFDIHCLEKAAREAGCQPDGTDYPVAEVKKKVPNTVPKFCGLYGKPSSDGNIRLYTQNECNNLSGNWHANGECIKRTGGSFSWECRELNTMKPPVQSTKDKYDIMTWGNVLQYFSDLYQNMHSSDPNVVTAATKKCLGITIAQPEVECGDVRGISYYCYKWEYDYGVSSGKIPTSLYYGRMSKDKFIEISNNGPYTIFNIGTDRIYMRVKGNIKNKGNATATKIWVQTEDGISVRVDGNNMLQKFYDQGPTAYETPIFTLNESSDTPFEMDWYNNYGGYVFATRLWLNNGFVPIPSNILTQAQPSGYPIARWDFYEGVIEDRCKTLNSQVVGNVPYTAVDGKKCVLFTDKNYIQITNGIAASAFRSITMMVYVRSDPSGYPRFWEFNNSRLGDNGNWCQDSIFGTASPNNSLGSGYYCMLNCSGQSQWSGSNNFKTGKWYHMVWTIDSTGKVLEHYLDGTKVTSMVEPTGILGPNKTYKNMYIMNSVEMFNKDMAVAWFRIYDYTLTANDIRADKINGFSTSKLYPMSAGSGWDK
jgi:hypothetical protein